jgi:hypothetical protein
VGQGCFARFHWDKQWYRGVVEKQMGNDWYIVKLIDYGTTVYVSPQEMRKDIFQTNVPSLALQVRIKGIGPKGNSWNQEDVLKIHQMVVDKKVTVTPTSKEQTWPLEAVVRWAEGDGIDVAEVLVFHQLAAK